MRTFKSRWFWICVVFSVCAAVFFGIAIHQAKQPPEVIKVYKVVKSVQRVTPQSSEDSSIAGTISHETEEMGTFAETAGADFLDDASHHTDEFTHISDDFFVDELPAPEIADAQVDDLNTDSATQAEGALATQKLAELRIEIPQHLQERLDLLDLVEELAEFAREDEEIDLIRRQTFDETVQLRTTIFDLSHEYIRYSDGDLSPFQPGGDFYDLFVQNHMGVESAER